MAIMIPWRCSECGQTGESDGYSPEHDCPKRPIVEFSLRWSTDLGSGIAGWIGTVSASSEDRLRRHGVILELGNLTDDPHKAVADMHSALSQITDVLYEHS